MEIRKVLHLQILFKTFLLRLINFFIAIVMFSILFYFNLHFDKYFSLKCISKNYELNNYDYLFHVQKIILNYSNNIKEIFFD